MKAVVVVDKNLAIGKDGGLLFHIPSDLMHFRSETIGKTIIMGRKTLESMPGGRPLPKRNTLVLSSSFKDGEVFWEKDGWYGAGFSSLAALADWIREKDIDPDDLAVAGGGAIYGLLLPLTDELVITEVEAAVEDPDTYFPEFRDEFVCYEDSGLISEDGYNYHIKRYRRNDG